MKQLLCLGFSFVFLLMAVAMSATPATAQSLRFQTDATAPLQLTAGQLVWQHDTQLAEASDKARLSQGDLVLSAERMIVHMDETGRASHLTASGQVRLRDATQRAEAGQAAYDFITEKLVLRDNVVVMDRPDDTKTRKLSGARLQLDMRTGKARLGGGRARIELHR